MKKFIIILASSIFLYGCPAAWFVAGGVATLGGYVYVEGLVAREYPLEYKQAWNTVNRVLQKMKISISNSSNKDGKGRIEAVRKDGESVSVILKDRGQKVTTISIRVGKLGNKYDGEMIHDEIASMIGVR